MFDYFVKDVGIDLGTSNCLVYLKNKGIVIDEPSIVAINNKTNRLLTIGHEAKKILGREPSHISVIRPLTYGIVSDFEMSKEIIKNFLRRISDQFFNYYRVVVGIPVNLTEVEKKSAEDVIISAGANKVYLIEEPILAAIGARLPINEPVANLIVDIGGGTTDIAIVSFNGSAVSKSLKIAGEKLTNDIVQFVKDEYKLLIGEATAEEAKIKIGSATPLKEKLEMPIRGRDLSSGLPKEIIIKDHQVRSAISKSLKSIIEAVKETIEKAPPELVGDILKQGIFLCGGGSLLKGINELFEQEIGVKTTVVDDPLTCVIRGAGIVSEDLKQYSHFFSESVKPLEINQ